MLEERIRKNLCSVAHAVASQYGKSCEVAIHDLTGDNTPEHSIIFIENGEVTGRKVGDGASAVVLEQLKGESEAKDRIGYFTRTQDGRLLKSSTSFIRDEEGNVVAVFSINHDITAMSVTATAINEIFRQFEPDSNEIEHITPHVEDLLDELMWKSAEMIGKPVTLMNKEDKKRAIRWLNSKGALLITRSGDKIAKYFGISKFTLYSYIDVKENKEAQP